ncbi:MAG: tRNA preQ1(34) S-adenosylmethionine ribosyltransferase-isomerase QueA [Deltaproteobacteria bacterium]|nr:tRNA preQ1(34) S-adenosylmethionine ribosyltransferase-isomerase QueA [Deltaproteobacteria bacterium]
MSGSLADYAFELPPGSIAQEPSPERDRSRLLVLNRRSGGCEHLFFQDIERYFQPGDVLVVNDTRVFPVNLVGRKKTGARVECLILNYPTEDPQGSWEGSCLLRGGRKFNPGDRLDFGAGIEGEILPARVGGNRRVRFCFSGTFQERLEACGQVPLPPYIRRQEPSLEQQRRDRERYQTVYAAHPGAVAAPTAGLHFTSPLLARIKDRGVLLAPVTLHVGYGTFAPVKSEDPTQHRMHPETYHLPEETVRIIREQQQAGKRIWAVGTTSVRVLEYVAGRFGELQPSAGECDLFIRPGFEFKVVDRMITNFHLPKTTLILLVSAFAGRENILRAYGEAIERGYRFYSYGDAMLII